MSDETQVQTTQESPVTFSGDAIVIGLTSEPLSGFAATVDQALGGLLTELIQAEEISTKPFKVSTLFGTQGVQAPVVMTVGLGDRDNPERGLARRAAGAASKSLGSKQRQRVGFFLDVEDIEQAVCGAMVGCVGQDLFQAEKSLHPIHEIVFATNNESMVNRGEVLGRSMNLTRRLVNLPASDIYPQSFAEHCEKVGANSGFDVEVWDENKLKEEKCHALLAVAQGSDRPGRLVIMKHLKGGDLPTLALVGKGVTFDSGGLSLKPTSGMLDMKCDMTGAATVLGAMSAIASLDLPVNVIGLAGLAENMVSGDSFKLGDVITARSGKTIEVHNTDAEGRLVLADTLNVAIEQGADEIVDLATLTGACCVALGLDTSGLMTNDQELCDHVKKAANSVGELAWQLPMFPEFGEQIRSKVADIKNVGAGRWGGAMTAAKLLEEFVEEKPWVHIDIAGPSFGESPKAWVDAGASGCFVNALVALVEKRRSS